MPSLQVVNTTRDKPEPTGVHQFFSKLGESYKESQDQDMIGSILSDYQNNRDKANAWEDAQLNLEKSTISPTRRLQAQQLLNESKKTLINEDKVINDRYKTALKEAQGPKKTQASQPVDPDQLKRIKETKESQGFEDLSPSEKNFKLLEAGVSKENAEPIAKLAEEELKRSDAKYDSAYKAQEKFIDSTTNSYKAFETDTKPKLLQMQHLNPDDLIGPVGSQIFEKLGLPLGSLEDPSSELYQKLSLDLLKGLPETYGNRILKVEVDNFLKTVPGLVNSPNGRRMIASNILKLGEMKELYYDEMRKQQLESLDTGKPLPRDFQQRVFDQVKPQIDRVNNEFVKMSEIKEVPKGTIPFFNPMGEIEFVPQQDEQWALENGGRKIW